MSNGHQITGCDKCGWMGFREDCLIEGAIQCPICYKSKSSTPAQKPVLTLEETITSLRQERERAKAGLDRTLKIIEEGDSLARGIGEMALQDWKQILARSESALHHLEVGKALALLTERKPEYPINESEVPPLRTFVTGDNSICLHVREDVAYDVHPNGDLVAVRKRGDITYYHEWSVDDLTEIKSSPQPSQQEKS
jgi:uncharacterized Zn finger protein (UPF0148 family)